MRKLIFAYLGGMLASIPIAAIFGNAGVGMMDNVGSLELVNRMSILEIIEFYSLLLFVPPIGAAIGAKIGGRQAEVHYMIGRGTGGQITAFILMFIALNTYPGFAAELSALTANGQTIAVLGLLQIGCTLGAVWGI